MKLKQHSVEYISKQFVTFPDEFRAFYVLIHEVSSGLQDDFMRVELGRSLSIPTFVAVQNQDFDFLNNFVLAYFFKNALMSYATDIEVNYISVQQNECEQHKRLDTVFYETINFLNRAIRHSRDLNYYVIHEQLKVILKTKNECQILFKLNNYPVKLYCAHMNISLGTYENAQRAHRLSGLKHVR